MELGQRAMEIAKRIGQTRFSEHYEREDLIADAVSRAWEGARTARDGVTAASIAWFAVKRIASVERRFDGSKRSITHPRHRETVRIGEFVGELSNELRDDPALIVQVKLDYLGWLRSIRPRLRWIMLLMLAGWTTGELAKRFKLSPARIVQFRRELIDSWVEFTNG